MSSNRILSSIAKPLMRNRWKVGVAGGAAVIGVFGGIQFAQNPVEFASMAKQEKAHMGVLDEKNFNPFCLKEIKPYNHNTKQFVFELKDRDSPPHVPTASFILTRYFNGSKEVVRPYTPIDHHEHGVLNLLIKNYEQGNMSKHIHSMKVGDTLDFKGSIQKIAYKPNMKAHIGMVAGGTGITPMIQVINTILSNPQDKTKVTLVFANIAPEDILLKERLDSFAKKYDKQFKVYYVLEKPPKNWNGGTGFVNEQILKTNLPPPTKDNLVMVCGPPGMMKAISGDKNPDYSQGPVDGLLLKLKYNSDQVFKF